MASIQDLIHRFEEKGSSGIRIVFVVLVTLGVLVCYNWRSYRNLGTQEAMDAAQVGRNLAEGNGFTPPLVPADSCVAGPPPIGTTVRR